MACPTNDDPNFEDRPRVKRTTGIPRSFLKKVEKPTAVANDGTTDENKRPPGLMVNADGDWVVAEPDKAAWEQFQAKAKMSAVAQEEASKGKKELQDRGLECPIDKHLFVEPTKTPCCKTTYCNQCITNALLDDDLQCPGCGKGGILIDDLVPDVEMAEKVRGYQGEQISAQKTTKEDNSEGGKPELNTKSGGAVEPSKNSKSPSPPANSGENSAAQPGAHTASKKRKAESELPNDHKNTGGEPPKGPAASTGVSQKSPAVFPPELDFMNQPFSAANMMGGMNAMAFPNMMGMPMNMPGMPNMAVIPGMMNPMMMPNAFMPMGNQWPVMNGNFGANGAAQNGNMGRPGFPSGLSQMNNNMGRGGQVFGGRGRGGQFSNQQRNNFGGARQGAEDSPYFRQPVNPHRQQNRRAMPRPADYREI
jgi:protein MPE1